MGWFSDEKDCDINAIKLCNSQNIASDNISDVVTAYKTFVHLLVSYFVAKLQEMWASTSNQLWNVEPIAELFGSYALFPIEGQPLSNLCTHTTEFFTQSSREILILGTYILQYDVCLNVLCFSGSLIFFYGLYHTIYTICCSLQCSRSKSNFGEPKIMHLQIFHVVATLRGSAPQATSRT